MAKKPSIATLVGGFASSSRLNTIFQQILDAFDNTLSRDGSTPNTMEADLDLNNNDLLNAKEVRATKLYAGGVQVTDATYVPNWRGEWATTTSYVVNDIVRNDGNVYICLIAHTSGTFSADLGAARWELFASKGSAGAGTGDLLAANNLSDLSDTAAARTNLGLSIGNDVLAYSTKSAALAAATWAANKLILLTGTDTVSTVDSSSLVPSGAVFWFAANTAPTGYLVCDGTAVSRTTYATLFSIVGTTFGAGDGTTFNLPDLRGEFIRGWDNSRGVDSGRVFGSAQGNAVGPIEVYRGSVVSSSSVAGMEGASTKSGLVGTGTAGGSYGAAAGGDTLDVARGVNNASETRPRNVALLPCIKT